MRLSKFCFGIHFFPEIECAYYVAFKCLLFLFLSHVNYKWVTDEKENQHNVLVRFLGMTSCHNIFIQL